MDSENLHALISRYESDMDLLYGPQHGELFKWRAIQCWQAAWTRPESDFANFAERFSAARQGFSIFIDNSRMHPSNGVVKLWEREPERVERLFSDALFAPDGGDLRKRQANMDAFVDGFEALRRQYYPGSWSYKQDRHSASVFLAVNAPAENYVFKFNEASMMARYTGFERPIGAGKLFRLDHYYELCDRIVEALREHESLLEKHFNWLDENCFVDRSLHMLAFDLMYCCRTYGYYQGLIPPKRTGKSSKAPQAATGEEQERRERERQEEARRIEQQILECEQRCDGCEEISLLGVEVTSERYGRGIVVDQNVNSVKIRFAEAEKTFKLDGRYPGRPRFENDEQIVELFTAYAREQERIRELRQRLAKL